MLDNIEFEHGGITYRIRRLSAMQQFHLSRRVSPLIPPLIPVFMAAARKVDGKDGVKVDALAAAGLLGPFADGLAAMPDDAAETIINICLGALRRKAAGTDEFVPVWNAAAKAAMFEDVNDMGQLLPLTLRVIREALGPFIQGLLTSQMGQTEAIAPK